MFPETSIRSKRGPGISSNQTVLISDQDPEQSMYILNLSLLIEHRQFLPLVRFFFAYSKA